MKKVRVLNASRCGAPEGEVIEVSDERAARWLKEHWVGELEDKSDDAGDSLPTKKAELVALYTEELGKEPTKDDLGKVTVATLTEAIQAHREDDGE